MLTNRKSDSSDSLIFGQPAPKLNLEQQELEFYESMINRFKDTANTSLLNKRAAIAKEDPAEEIYELHLEIQEFEK